MKTGMRRAQSGMVAELWRIEACMSRPTLALLHSSALAHSKHGLLFDLSPHHALRLGAGVGQIAPTGQHGSERRETQPVAANLALSCQVHSGNVDDDRLTRDRLFRIAG